MCAHGIGQGVIDWYAWQVDGYAGRRKKQMYWMTNAFATALHNIHHWRLLCCTVFVVCLSLLWIRNKRFNPRWRRKQHRGVRPYRRRRQWTQHQWSNYYSGSNCYTSSCFSSHHVVWHLSCCSTRKHCFRAMWTRNVLQTMCWDTCGIKGHCPICRGPIDTTVQFYNN